ncbi:hypothetical protein N9901_01455 [Flavobacteriaceae bacterium]|nr:hypothetical protein [Flavobacteriaceae bacterium]
MEDWISIQSKDLFLDPDYLKAIEESSESGIQFFYVVVKNKELEVCAIICYQLLKVDESLLSQKSVPNQLTNNLISKVINFIGGNVLVQGSYFNTGTHGYSKNHLITDKQFLSLTNGIINTIHKEYEKVNLIIHKEFYNDDLVFKPFQEELKNYKFIPFEIDVNMVLPIATNWQSFDDYLSTMSTKYRTRAKNVLKKTKDIQVRELSLDDLDIHADTIFTLYNNVIKTAKFNMAQLNVVAFKNLKKAIGNAFVITGYFLGDKMVAFTSAYKHGVYFEANYLGIDYDVNKQYPLYQKVLYQFVKHSIEDETINVLRFGRTAEQIKSCTGALPSHMTLYLKHRNSILNLLAKPILKTVSPTEFELRKPFKNKYYQ